MYFSIVMIVLSSATLLLGTLPDLRLSKATRTANFTSPHVDNWPLGCVAMLDDEHDAFVFVELFCVIWFTLELLARLLVVPSVRALLVEPMTYIDLLSFLPFYVTLVLVRSRARTPVALLT